jgi:hypothetical protein
MSWPSPSPDHDDLHFKVDLEALRTLALPWPEVPNEYAAKPLMNISICDETSGFNCAKPAKPYPISLPLWSTIVPPTSPRRWRWPGRNSRPTLDPRVGHSA